MALKFLNKKGWHTGSLRNIENVWKAEQKQEAEQKKLEELRKQIREERERAEFRELQVQAGLIPKQERLEFLYDSGLAVGKGGSSFKSLESLPPKTDPEASSSASAKQESAVPGALFEEKEKPQSANDAWRKLHSDPLLMIRQREQEALARVKNNPVQMAMIRKSVEAKKGKDKDKDDKKQSKKHHKKKSKHRKHSSSENDSDHDDAALTVEKRNESRHKGSIESRDQHRHLNSSERVLTEEKHRESRHRGSKYDRPSNKSNEESSEGDARRMKYHDNEYKDQRRNGASAGKSDRNDDQQRSNKGYHDSQRKYSPERQIESRSDQRHNFNSSEKPPRNESNNKRRNAVKLSEEERAARLREMQMDAERHEEQRWKRLKKAADSEAQEVMRDHVSSGRNFLDAAQRSVFGAEKGGSSTIEESVRRRMHYSQRNSAADSNAFRRA